MIVRVEDLEEAHELVMGVGHEPILHAKTVLALVANIDRAIPGDVTTPVREALTFAYLRALDDLMGWTPTGERGQAFGDRHSRADSQLQLYCKLHFSTK
jgi:hypothetical protein